MSQWLDEVREILKEVFADGYQSAIDDGHKAADPGFTPIPETEALQIAAVVKREVQAELQNILNSASGGGNWRRVIETRLAQLRSGE